MPKDVSEKRELPSLKASEALYRQDVVRPAAKTKFLPMDELQKLDIDRSMHTTFYRLRRETILSANHHVRMHCFVS